ncbi:MAG TPA: hypothetical protein VN915_00310 [Elusimicrobiota bacterium]|nr:hypothetical protein [Elusimicrobiota bacterium]
MSTRRPGSGRAFAALAVGGSVLALLAPALRRGEGLLPVGSLWRVPPWNAVLPPQAGNGLLSDQLLNFWPWRLFLRAELLQGRFPLWNPLIAGGVPFAGCVQAAPFFPISLLIAVLPPAAWSLAAAFLKLFIAGWFTSLHARRLGADRTGAALAGVSFALSGFMIAWLGHPQTNAACLLPALFWSLGRAFEPGERSGHREPRAWVPPALIAGLILLAGHPPTELHVLAAGGCYALFLAWRAPRPDRARLLGAAALAAAAGALLAAPALLPYVEYLRLSSTAGASASLARWSTRLAPWSLLHLLMPLASGAPGRGAEVLGPAAFGLDPASNFLERAGWVGLPALAFAALAVARRPRDASVRFHAGLALFGLAAAFGLPPLPSLWRALPGFSSANPTRLLLLFCFGAATLAGLGGSSADEIAPKRWRAGLLLFFAGALFLYFGAASRAWGGLTAAESRSALEQAAWFAAEAAAALALLSLPRAARWAPLAAAVFLLHAAAGVNPSAPADLLYPRTPAIGSLAAAQGEGRVLGLGAALAPDVGMALGLRDARGRDFTTVRRYEELVTGSSGDFDFFEGTSSMPANPRLLAVSAVAATPRFAGAVPADWRLVHEGDLAVFLAPQPGRRALFVPAARSAAPLEVLKIVRAPAFDPSAVAWLDDGPAGAETAAGRGSARVVRETSGEVVVETRADAPGWLVLLDTWFPGWRAEVNGAPADLRRADYDFRAVRVPAGTATARFTYAPWSFRLGLLLAALGALALAAAWAYRPAGSRAR